MFLTYYRSTIQVRAKSNFFCICFFCYKLLLWKWRPRGSKTARFYLIFPPIVRVIHVSKTHQQCISYHKSPFNFNLDSCYDNTQCSTMSEHMFAHKILGSGTEKFSVHYIQVRACSPDFESPQAEKNHPIMLRQGYRIYIPWGHYGSVIML